jgi:hypothetical protein
MTVRNEKLRAKMQASKQGWGYEALERLYTGFGFTFRDGSKHRVYWHPEHPKLMATVTRANKLPIGYIQYALKLIDQLELAVQSSETKEGQGA